MNAIVLDPNSGRLEGIETLTGDSRAQDVSVKLSRHRFLMQQLGHTEPLRLNREMRVTVPLAATAMGVLAASVLKARPPGEEVTAIFRFIGYYRVNAMRTVAISTELPHFLMAPVAIPVGNGLPPTMMDKITASGVEYYDPETGIPVASYDKVVIEGSILGRRMTLESARRILRLQ